MNASNVSTRGALLTANCGRFSVVFDNGDRLSQESSCIPVWTKGPRERKGKSSVWNACDGDKTDTFYRRIFFGRKASRFFCDFSPPPWGRPFSEVLTYLWVLAMVTFVAEATGTVRTIVADQSGQLAHGKGLAGAAEHHVVSLACLKPGTESC